MISQLKEQQVRINDGTYEGYVGTIRNEYKGQLYLEVQIDEEEFINIWIDKSKVSK